MSTQSFPYRKLTIIPLLTGGLVGLFLLLMSVGSDLVHPHGGLILFVFVFIGLTVAGLIFVPLCAVQAIRCWCEDRARIDSTNVIVSGIGIVYLGALFTVGISAAIGAR